MKLAVALAVLLTIAAGTAQALAGGPPSLPEEPPNLGVHVYWYLGRSAGFVSYWLLFFSAALGLAVSSRIFDGVLTRPWVFEVHKFVSIFVIVVMLFHALIFLPDPYAQFTPAELFVPLTSHYRPGAIALGIAGLYGSAAISASFYLKRLITQRGWRVLHYGTFGLTVAALLHGVLAGTDSSRPTVQLSYLASGAALLFLTFFRILATRKPGSKPAKAHASAPAGVRATAPSETN